MKVCSFPVTCNYVWTYKFNVLLIKFPHSTTVIVCFSFLLLLEIRFYGCCYPCFVNNQFQQHFNMNSTISKRLMNAILCEWTFQWTLSIKLKIFDIKHLILFDEYYKSKFWPTNSIQRLRSTLSPSQGLVPVISCFSFFSSLIAL